MAIGCNKIHKIVSADRFSMKDILKTVVLGSPSIMII